MFCLEIGLNLNEILNENSTEDERNLLLIVFGFVLHCCWIAWNHTNQIWPTLISNLFRSRVHRKFLETK